MKRTTTPALSSRRSPPDRARPTPFAAHLHRGRGDRRLFAVALRWQLSRTSSPRFGRSVRGHIARWTTALLFDRDRGRGDRRLDASASRGSAARRVLWIDLEHPTERRSTDLAGFASSFDRDERPRADGRRRERRPELADYGELPPRHRPCAGRGRRARRSVDCLVSEALGRDGPRGPARGRRDASASARQARARPDASTASSFSPTCSSGCSRATSTPSRRSSSISRRSTRRRCRATSTARTRCSRGSSRCAREIGRLRRALTSHREPILALTRPELEAIASSDSAERFSVLRDAARGGGAGRARQPRVRRRIVRRPHREHRPADERDHEGAHARLGADPSGHADRGCHGHELQARALRHRRRTSGWCSRHARHRHRRRSRSRAMRDWI